MFETIKTEFPSISLGTVYKTLETFSEVGIIKRVMNAENAMRYDGNTNHHNHIYCINSNEIIDYEDTELQELIHSYLKGKNIENLDIIDVSVQINAEKKNINKQSFIH